MGVEDRISFLESDLFAAIPADFQADIIVSNPPYVGHSEIDNVDVSVREFEPAVAVFAGDNGSEIIQRMVLESTNFLAVGGYLIFETSPVIFDRCLEITTAATGYSEPVTIRDLAGHRRIIQVQFEPQGAVQ